MEKTVIPSLLWQGKFFRDAKVSSEEKLLYLYLVSCERNNFLGLYYAPAEHIACDIAMDTNTVKALLNRLIDAKLIRYDTENNYVFIPWTIEQLDLRPSHFSRAKHILKGTPAKALVGEIKLRILGKTKKEKEEIKQFLNEIPGEPKRFAQEKIQIEAPEKKKRARKKKEEGPDEAFEEFWKVYPRKEGKEETRRLFASMQCSQEEKQQFVIAAKNYASTCKAKGTAREYISTPKNFIKSGKCYDFLMEQEKVAYTTDSDVKEVIENV